mmetsp:Transcript_926/g.3490  ORF Transcript_926/g.3490 Transcript_926/m.3490 type:complete len:295 (-) Transcript_926:1904-2788(-)
MHHYFRSLGGYSFGYAPYVAEGIYAHLDSEEMQRLYEIEDPFFYLDRIKSVPKFVSVSTNDEFFSLDDSRFWWHPERVGAEASLYIMPDSDHMSWDEDAHTRGIEALFRTTAAEGVERPRVRWSLDREARRIRVEVEAAAKGASSPPRVRLAGVRLVHARLAGERFTGARRDFRWKTLQTPCPLVKTLEENLVSDPPKWVCPNPVSWSFSRLLEPLEEEEKVEEDPSSSVVSFSAQVPSADPALGVHYAAGFLELTFVLDEELRFSVTTEALVTPDEYPFPDCSSAQECAGTLV